MYEYEPCCEANNYGFKCWCTPNRFKWSDDDGYADYRNEIDRDRLDDLDLEDCDE